MEQRLLIGLNNLWTDPATMHAPELDSRRAIDVLTKIDDLLSWQRKSETERDERFVELGEYLCEVRAGRYWRIENLHSFDEFLEKIFPQSRRKAYYLVAIHEQLPKPIRRELGDVGWSKGKELVKVLRHDGEQFDSATWLHSAKNLSKDDFRLAVERHITGKNVEPWDLIYFKLGKSQLPIVEDALEKASLMLGVHRSRGYCLEMICADFLAGVSLEEPNPANLVTAIGRLLQILDQPTRTRIIHDLIG
jgi:hypothetical protein